MEFSLTEMVLIAFVALLLYGGRLPKIAMAVGRALGEFRKGLRETSDMVRYEIQQAERASVQPTRRPSEPPPERYGEDGATGESLATEDISLPDAGEAEPDAPPVDEVAPPVPPPSA